MVRTDTSGGQESVSYVVQTGDILTNIVEGLALAVNADSNLQALGISAVWTSQFFTTVGSLPTAGPCLYIQSNSPNTTTYTYSRSTGASETISLVTSTTGICQNWTLTRNLIGNVMQSIDPAGRQFTFTYAPNGIDLLSQTESQVPDSYSLGTWQYTGAAAPHCPTSFVNGSGQLTTMVYNSYGEPTSVTDPTGDVTSLTYNSNGYLTQLQGPLSGSNDITTFNFYLYGPLQSITNSEGYTVNYSYDGLNRLTNTSYMDGTSEQTIYDKLDAIMHCDRIGRWSQSTFDSMDQLASSIDPLGRKTSYTWCSCGSLKSLTDPLSHTTSWQHDLEGRITQKTFADSTTISYSYEPYLNLVSSTTDALNQTTNLAYNMDNKLQGTTYANAVNATSAVFTAYDTNFSRVTGSTNGWGSLSYGYNHYGTNTAALIGGTPTTGDYVTINVNSPALNSLAGGVWFQQYHVTSSDTSLSILLGHIAAAINANSTFSSSGVTATSNGSIVSLSANGSPLGITSCANGVTTITLGGTSTTSDKLTVTAYDSTLAGGQVSVTATAGSTLTASATAISTAINSALSSKGISSTASGAVVSITSTSKAATTFSTNTNFGATETMTLAGGPTETTSNVIQPSAWLSGIPVSGDYVNIDVANTALSGGKHNVQYHVGATDTSLVLLAKHIATQINGDTALSTVGITSATDGQVLRVSSSNTSGAVTISTSTNGKVTESIGGTATASDTVSIIVMDAGLTGGSVTKTYTVLGGDTPSTIASALASAINGDTNLSGLGITASASSNVVTITSLSPNATTYGYLTSSGATETVSQAGGPSAVAGVGGGGRLQSAANSVIANSLCTYGYDALNRTFNRSINGSANSSNWQYDQISRVTGESNPLGTFAFQYVNDTYGSSYGDPRLASIGYPNGQSTNFSYLPNIQDQLLQQIKNIAPSAALLSQFNYAFDSAGQIRQWQQQQNSTNIHQSLGYDFASQLTSAVNDSGSSLNAYISGVPHAGDVISVTAYDASLTGSTPPGQETASYTVISGDTSSSIAANLASAISTAMSNISVTTSATGSIINIVTSPNYCTQFTCAVSGTGATDTIALSGSSPVQNLHKQLYCGYDLAGNRIGVQGDSSGSFPTGLTTSATQYTYNNVNELTATAAGGPIAFQASTVNPISSASINVTETATIGGTITAGDVVTITVTDKGLSQPENVNYTVLSTDTTTSIATALTSAINADSNLSGIGVSATSSAAVVTVSSSSKNASTYTAGVSSGATETVALNGTVGTMTCISPATSLTGAPVLASGSNTASITAVSGGGTPATNTYPITISSATSTSLTYDNNGNLTNDGTNSYAWDAENVRHEVTNMNGLRCPRDALLPVAT